MPGKRIGILTSGGDCPGLNAVLRAASRTAEGLGMELVGFHDGFEGLLAPSAHTLLDRAATRAAAPLVADIVAPLLGWDTTTRDAQLAHFVDECAREDAAALVTESEFIASTSSGHTDS